MTLYRTAAERTPGAFYKAGRSGSRVTTIRYDVDPDRILPWSTNQGFITCLPNGHVPLNFLFHWLTENVPTFQRMASGATFKEISRGVFKTIGFLHPSAALVRRFESQIEPMANQMLALQRQIQNLRQTRDLLLPRLLSGQASLS